MLYEVLVAHKTNPITADRPRPPSDHQVRVVLVRVLLVRYISLSYTSPRFSSLRFASSRFTSLRFTRSAFFQVQSRPTPLASTGHLFFSLVTENQSTQTAKVVRTKNYRALGKLLFSLFSPV